MLLVEGGLSEKRLTQLFIHNNRSIGLGHALSDALAAELRGETVPFFVEPGLVEKRPPLRFLPATVAKQLRQSADRGLRDSPSLVLR